MPPGFVWHITGILTWSKFRVRWWDLLFGKLFKTLAEEHHLQCCRRKRATWAWDLRLTASPVYTRMLCKVRILLTQTKETDTPGFYSFGNEDNRIVLENRRQNERGNHWYHGWNKQMKHTSSKSYTWCSLETGILSCINSEMLLSWLLGSPSIFMQWASLWGTFSICLLLDRKEAMGSR